MTTTSTQADASTGGSPLPARGDMKLEVVVLPVSDVDPAKRFYESLGWRLDGDLFISDEFRVVQFTPPGSLTSIRSGTGIKDASLGSALSLDLVVQNVDAARADLLARGVHVSEVFHGTGIPRQGWLPSQ